MSSPRRIRVVVEGRVQGVGFRYFTQAEASALGVVGSVRNLPDGCVELEAQGSQKDLDALVEAVSRGPALSRVDRVTVTDRPLDPASHAFRITS